jgi:hypothetical protein
MRISSARALRRYVLAFVVIAGAVVLMKAPTTTGYTVYDREYYLAPDAIQFVRPGLDISIQSAQIGSDGTISTDSHITDVPGRVGTPAAGRHGCQHTGPISVSFLIPYIPGGQQN